MNKGYWWGYLHISGTIQAKPYYSEQDIQEARDSPFVKRVINPFQAPDRDSALAIIEERIIEELEAI